MPRVGIAVLVVGILWDVAFHATQLLITGVWPGWFDLVGNAGHVITLAGLILIVLPLLRRRQGRK